MSKEKENNITVKIFALVIATILWSYVMSEVNPKMTKEIRNIDVSFTNLDSLDSAGIIPMEPKELKVNVKISGRRSDVIKITEDDITAKVDLSGYTEGSKKVPIDVSIASSKVELIDYDPKVVMFKFESVATKKMPVQVKTAGKLDSGYILGDFEVESQSVFIKGPKSWINSVWEALAIVDISGKTSDISSIVPIKLVDKDGDEVRGIEKDPNMVEVSIPIYKIKSVPIKLQTVDSLSNYEINNINITPKNIEIKGKGDIVDKISFIKTVPIDLSSLIKNKSKTVELSIPEGVGLVNSDKKIFVTLDEDTNVEVSPDSTEKIITKNFNYNFDEIGISNLDPQYIIENKDSIENVSITIKGSESRIAEVTKKDFSPEIDLSGLIEGNYDVRLKVKEISGIEVVEIVPPNLQIILKKE